jgi:sirohydrochlorin ferrochelatase
VVRDIAVIGLAHGSRHPEGCVAIERLMAAVGSQGGVLARAAYLDLAQPDLESVARELAGAGHAAALVVPLLFTSAFHATVDAPDAVRRAAEASGLEFTIAEILGTGDDIAELLVERLTEAAVPVGCSVLLFAVGSSNPTANQSVVDLAARLSAGRPGEVRAAFGTTDPRPATVLDALPEPIAVLPLFLADGLLLSPLRAMSAERGWSMIEPLGDRAAAIVLRRYDGARTSTELR